MRPKLKENKSPIIQTPSFTHVTPSLSLYPLLLSRRKSQQIAALTASAVGRCSRHAVRSEPSPAAAPDAVAAVSRRCRSSPESAAAVSPSSRQPLRSSLPAFSHRTSNSAGAVGRATPLLSATRASVISAIRCSDSPRIRPDAPNTHSILPANLSMIAFDVKMQQFQIEIGWRGCIPSLI
ncbi:uncharacterized protein LOC121786602 [Salvia splendens]|uniref:uncharacterized protein LOC121786602 n=1 Tax=Salvia splendens TaxID=180675 RepID=UPI001C26D83A|nr:uncharacterized protein LOC121786602 [Salvia splendens]